MNPLSREFYRRDTVRAARAMIGMYLVRDGAEGRAAGRIVETEAYLSEGDPACHAHRGPTRRNGSMFGPPGHAYVYLIYGVHRCFNAVTRPAGVGEAVLVRALEPVEGVELMERRRGTSDLRQLCSGPGKLVQALGIGPEDDGCDLLEGRLRILAPERRPRPRIACGPRIGITKAAELELRFTWAESPFLSRR